MGGLGGAAYIDPAQCQGCGTCTGECPANAIQLVNYTDEQIMLRSIGGLGRLAARAGGRGGEMSIQHTPAFEPEITAFYCIFCGYMAADTAGAGDPVPGQRQVRAAAVHRQNRHPLPAGSLRAGGGWRIRRGLPDGQLPPRARQRAWLARLKRARHILDEIGIGGERLDMFFMSGSQAHAFAMAAQTMTERIRELGPNPLKLVARPGEVADVSEPDLEDEVGWRGRKPRQD